MQRIKSILGDKSNILEEIIGMEFKSKNEFLQSVKSWMGNEMTEGEEVIVVNESACNR